MGSIKAEDCKLELKQTKGEYSFTLEIPAKTGTVLGFDVKIDDADGKRLTETALGPGKELHRNRCNFNLVK